MADREKVIGALVECEPFRLQCSKEQCPYYKDNHCLESLHNDALSLLKEQEAQTVLSNRCCESAPCRYIRKGFCPKCHQEVAWLLNRNYCGFCGQAVKWDA